MRPRLGFVLALSVAAALHAVVLLVPHPAGREDFSVPSVVVTLEPAGATAAVGAAQPEAAVARGGAADAQAPTATAVSTPSPSTSDPSPSGTTPVAPSPPENGVDVDDEPTQSRAPIDSGGSVQEVVAVPAGNGMPAGDAVPAAAGSEGTATSSHESGTLGMTAAAVSLPGTDLLMPRPRAEIRPDYPRAARKAGWEGVVKISAFVADTGVVLNAQVSVSSSHAALDQAALEAVRNTVFAPALQSGKAVACRVIVPVRFRLE